MHTEKPQDKAKEVDFFDRFAAADDYDVFMPQAKVRIIDAFARLSGLAAGARMLDVGCGSGAFTELLQQRGHQTSGLDISPKLIALAKRKFPEIPFCKPHRARSDNLAHLFVAVSYLDLIRTNNAP
jgi:ubiquinone/menaquinone biosynthesis C-methylase UbiE